MLNLKDQLVVVLSRQGQNWNPFTLLRNLKPALIPSDQLDLRPLPAPHGHGHTSEEENEPSGLISAALCCGEAQWPCIILQGSSLLMASIHVATIFFCLFFLFPLLSTVFPSALTLSAVTTESFSPWSAKSFSTGKRFPSALSRYKLAQLGGNSLLV